MDEKKGALRVKEKRTRKQTLDALAQCAKTIECAGCAYMDYITCKKTLLRDVFKIVQEQEQRIKELEGALKDHENLSELETKHPGHRDRRKLDGNNHLQQF